MREIMSADFISAFRYNPFVFVVLVYVVICFIIFNIAYLLNFDVAKKAFSRMVNIKVLIFTVICYAVFGIVRNLIYNPCLV